MKRIRCAVLILVLLSLLAVAAQIHIDTVTHNIIAALDQAHICAVRNDWEHARSFALHACSIMEDNRHIMEFFIKRETVASLALNLKGLSVYAQAPSAPDFIFELTRAKQETETLRHFFFSVF